MADFQQAYLFNDKGQSALVSSESEYHALWDAGWRDTPAAFGHETHPSINPMPVTALMPPAAPPAQQSEQMLEILQLMVSHQNQLAVLEARIAALEAPQQADPESKDQVVLMQGSHASDMKPEEAPHRARRS